MWTCCKTFSGISALEVVVDGIGRTDLSPVYSPGQWIIMKFVLLHLQNTNLMNYPLWICEFRYTLPSRTPVNILRVLWKNCLLVGALTGSLVDTLRERLFESIGPNTWRHFSFSLNFVCSAIHLFHSYAHEGRNESQWTPVFLVEGCFHEKCILLQ